MRMRLWLGLGMAAVAATGPFGTSSGGTITTIAGTGKPSSPGKGFLISRDGIKRVGS